MFRRVSEGALAEQPTEVGRGVVRADVESAGHRTKNASREG